MIDIAIHLLQALIGGLLIYWLRNDENEQAAGVRWTRSLWVGLAILFATGLIGYDMFTTQMPTIAVASTALAFGIVAFVITAPHGQTLRGPHQDIPADEDDPIFETAMFISGHGGGAGDRLGWPTWLIYQLLRYVLPVALLGALVGSWFVGVSGALIVIGYWPVGHLLMRPLKKEPQFIGAFLCGSLLFAGL